MNNNNILKKFISIFIIISNINSISIIDDFVCARTVNQTISNQQNYDESNKNEFWVLKERYYFECNIKKDIELYMSNIWKDILNKTVGSLGGKISNSDDQFLLDLKELFIKNTCGDYYRIERDDKFISKFKGSYQLMVNKDNISKINEKLSKILTYYLKLSKLNKALNFIEIIKSMSKEMKDLPQATKQVVWKILNEKVFEDRYGILNSYLQLMSSADDEKSELQELKQIWESI